MSAIFPQRYSLLRATYRLHFLPEYRCLPRAPFRLEVPTIFGKQFVIGRCAKLSDGCGEVVVNKDVLGTGDIIAQCAHPISVVVVLEQANTKSLVQFTNLLPNNTRNHHAEPVQHVGTCQFAPVTGSIASRPYSHFLHVCVLNGNHTLVSRAISYGTYQTELWMTAKMSEQIANPSVRDKSVVVQENQILTGCGARPAIVPCSEAEIALVRDHAGPRSRRTPSRKKLRRVICRSVVYHNDFHVRVMSESLDTVETHLRELALVVAQNNDADLREVGLNRGM
jgi:hypothetical protein